MWMPINKYGGLYKRKTTWKTKRVTSANNDQLLVLSVLSLACIVMLLQILYYLAMIEKASLCSLSLQLQLQIFGERKPDIMTD